MLATLKSLWLNRVLVWRLARRELEGQFRGSLLGLAWAALSPLAMLAVYTLVFGEIFGSRWPRPETATSGHEYAFSMLLFLGLTVFGLISEPLNRSPVLFLQNASYVKKVVFPLEVLPTVTVVSSAVMASITFVIFLVVYTLLYGLPPVTALALPLVLAPFLFIALAAAFLFSTLGVFLRDLRQIVPPLSTALLFLSPVFFAPEAVPEQFRWLLYLNPVTYAVNFARDVVFWGRLPDAVTWFSFLGASLVILGIAMFGFSRAKKAFADVL